MRHVILLEHGRLYRSADADTPVSENGPEQTLPPAAYDRLRRFDTRRPESEQVFTWYDRHARAAQWVGVIQLPGLIVEVLPKIDGPEALDDPKDQEDQRGNPPQGRPKVETRARANLLYMLAVAGDVPLRPQDVAHLEHQTSALSETLAALFARRLLAEMLRGPARGYLPLEENLRSLKGKLRLGPHLLHNAAHRERFFCQYDEFAEDIPLNRVFRAVCRILLGLTRLTGTQDDLRHCLLMLDDVQEVAEPRALLAHITLTRQQERFADLLSFARLILDHHAPLPGAGDSRCFSLMFDMNVVFERFIAGVLKKHVVPELRPQFPGLHLHAQSARTRTHLLETSTGAPTLLLKPDLVLQPESGPPFIIDTKWKRLDARARRAGVREADLYQLYAYATRFWATHSILLYPKVPDVPEGRYRLLKDSGPKCADHQHVGVRFVDLHGKLWEKPAQQALKQALRKMVVEGLGGDMEGNSRSDLPT